MWRWVWKIVKWVLINFCGQLFGLGLHSGLVNRRNYYVAFRMENYQMDYY